MKALLCNNLSTTGHNYKLIPWIYLYASNKNFQMKNGSTDYCVNKTKEKNCEFKEE